MLAAPASAGQKKDKQDKKIIHSARFFGSGGGHLGVMLREVDKKAVQRLSLPAERGALVEEVTPDSPAEKAGIQANDVIVGYQGDRVEGVAELVRLVRETPPGRTVAIEVVRKGTQQKVEAVLDKGTDLHAEGFEMPEINVTVPHFEMPHVEGPMMQVMPGHGGRFWVGEMGCCQPRRLGIRFQEIHGQLAEYFKLSGKHGVLVTSVEDDGPAATAGVKAGDVILKIGDDEIARTGDLRSALKDVEPGDQVALTVQRDGKSLDIQVKAGGEPRQTEKDLIKKKIIKKDVL
jgi:S1-C subfamily serine protease